MTGESIPSFDGVYETLPGGWLSRAEAELLYATAAATDGPILEVGCYRGRSTVLLAALGRPVYAVDPFDDFDSTMSGDEVCAIFRHNLLSRDARNVELFRQKVEDWSPRPVGFAYLDGDHSYDGTRAQIAKALSCAPAALAIHDVNDSGGGVDIKHACLELLGPWRRRVERLAVWRR